MTAQVDILVKATDQASGVLDKVGGASQKLFGSFTELKSAAGLVGDAGQALGQIYNALAGDTMEYAATVRQMSLISGANAEQTSRMIQLTDDFGLELGDLETAMRGAATKGISLTTDELARMSDEYLKLQDPVERNTYLLDNFGRSGLQMAKIMQQGSAAIREQAGAIEDNMVLTDEQVAKARQLEIELDNLNDSWSGIKNTIGNQVIPALVDAAQAFELLLSYEDRLAGATEKHNTEMVKSAGSYEAYIGEMMRAAEVAGYKIKVDGDQIRFLNHTADGMKDVTDKLGILSRAEFEEAHAAAQATQATEQQAAASSAAEKRMATYTSKVLDSGVAQQQYAYAVQQALTAQDNTRAAMAAMTDEAIRATDQYKSLQQATADLAAAQEKFNSEYGSKWVSALDKAGVKGEAYERALGAIDKAQGTNYLATKQANDALEQAVQQYQRTGDIEAFSQALDYQRGVWVQLNDNLTTAKTKFIEAQASFDKLMASIASAAGKRWTIKVGVEGEGGGGGGGGDTGGRGGKHGGEVNDFNGASGANFLVPSGYPNDSYRIGVSSGERVMIIPQGQSTTNSSISIGTLVIQGAGITNANQLLNELGRLTKRAYLSGAGRGW